jgi:DNA-binding transcriptional MerR regulator
MRTVIRAFSAFHVCRLTELSPRQLAYWDTTEFFTPYYASSNRRSPFSRVYSFDDVVGLRAIAILRNEHKVPLQRLRKIGQQLSEHHPWPRSGLVLYVARNAVHFAEPETNKIRIAGDSQFVFPIALRRIADEIRAKAEALRRRSAKQIGRLERHRNVAHNAWVVAGTRIPTKTIWRYHEAGYNAANIIRDYPLLKAADVASAIAHERQRPAKSG